MHYTMVIEKTRFVEMWRLFWVECENSTRSVLAGIQDGSCAIENCEESKLGGRTVGGKLVPARSSV